MKRRTRISLCIEERLVVRKGSPSVELPPSTGLPANGLTAFVSSLIDRIKQEKDNSRCDEE
jgi:hypothetical protein